MSQPWTSDPSRRPSSRRRRLAGSLRAAATEPERRLWWHLRHRLPLEAGHWRRQVPIKRYVVDFCCLAARLVIEVDGGQHGLESIIARDEARTRDLESDGYRVLRFSNREVMTSMELVLDTVLAALGTATPTPTPPRKGEGNGPVAKS